ncbi:nitroreductase family protein [Sphingomonas sp. 7/4-4]|uniref:nitroreductase family protein n=1 Tax=Sphingomonas sp. 7/4-4 TaxID=3018446 RepID=UPI00300DF5EC
MTDAERIKRARAFSDAMRTRRSCRAFAEEPVPREIIEAALTAAGSAPSGANRQPWHFSIVSSPEAKSAIRVAAEEEERAFTKAARAANGSRPCGRWARAPRSRFWKPRRG